MLYIMPRCSSASACIVWWRLCAQVTSEYYHDVWSVLMEALVDRGFKGVLVTFSATALCQL